MYCLKCGRETKHVDICRFCSMKESRNKYPIEYNNIDNLLCSMGCNQFAKFIFKNGNICCSKGQQFCPEVRRKNSENSKGKPSGMSGKSHSIETKEKMKGNIPWSKGLTKETDIRLKISGEKQSQHAKENRELNKKIYTQEQSELLNCLNGILKNKKLEEKSLKFIKYMKNRWKNDSEYRNKMSGVIGNYKGLVINDIRYASYDTNEKHISFCEEIKKDPENENILNVKCTYCGKWYRPTNTEVQNRIQGINGIQQSENRFYCSNECKELCPIFGQYVYPKDFKASKPQTEVDPTLRKMVFERDNYQCQKCESNCNLHCHHIIPASQNPILANDMDSCITLCKECHIEVHQNTPGCSYYDLRTSC